MGEAMAPAWSRQARPIGMERTASKADPLVQIGAEVVTRQGRHGPRATVFTMVSTTTI